MEENNKNYGICSKSCLAVHCDCKISSETVTELLLGETYEILEVQGSCTKIKMAYDNYFGWIDSRNIDKILFEKYLALNLASAVIAVDTIISKNGSAEIIVPTGAYLPEYNGCSFKILGNEIKYQGRVVTKQNPFELTKLDLLAKQKEGAPYRWGGKGPMGMDCSGFVQVLYRILGIPLIRDTSQQINQGILVESLKDAKKGDLFFGRSINSNSRHVGVILDGNQIAHCSSKLRIDTFSDDGIFDLETGKLSHTYENLRRVTNKLC